jgi:hypothetical protein
MVRENKINNTAKKHLLDALCTWGSGSGSLAMDLSSTSSMYPPISIVASSPVQCPLPPPHRRYGRHSRRAQSHHRHCRRGRASGQRGSAWSYSPSPSPSSTLACSPSRGAAALVPQPCSHLPLLIIPSKIIMRQSNCNNHFNATHGVMFLGYRQRCPRCNLGPVKYRGKGGKQATVISRMVSIF